MKTRFTLYIVSLIFIGCSTDTVGSNDINADAIHQDYSLYYQEQNNSSSLTAQFRVGGSTGTTVEIEPPAQLYMNGMSPKKSTFLGTSYSVSQSGALLQGQFDFVDNTGKLYSNSVLLKTITINANLAPIMLGTNYYVPVLTHPLTAGDNVSAVLEQEFVEGGISRYVFIQGQYQATTSSVAFSSYDLSRLRNGIARLTVSRTHHQSLTQASPRGGGEISSSYSSRPISLTIYGQTFAPNPLLPL